MSTHANVLDPEQAAEPVGVNRARQLLELGGYPHEDLTDDQVEDLLRVVDGLISFALSVREEVEQA